MEYCNFLKLFDNRFTLRVVCLFKIAWYVEHSLSVGYRHHNTLVHGTLVLIYLFNDRRCHRLYLLGLAIESLHGKLEGSLAHFVCITIGELLLCERAFHCKNF